jgi:hypothetical protein
MRRTRALGWLVVVCVTEALTQTTLPPEERTVIIAARSSSQATTQSPVEITLKSGARLTVSPRDVHDYATSIARGLVMKQASSSLSAGLVYVLEVKGVIPAGKSHVDIALTSGPTVRVPADDIRDARLSFLRTALAEARSVDGVPTPGTSQASSDGTSDATAVAIIRQTCAKEWPDDFRMRAYCQDQQDKGLAALRQRSMTGSPEHRTIRTKCAEEWPDDFRMRNYCEEKQLEALKVIR